MFEKVSRIAEQAATSASRRQFLGRIGTGAMATAAALAGLLVHAYPARAKKGGNKGLFCCTYHTSDRYCYSGRCPKFIFVKSRDDYKKFKIHLVSEVEISSCDEC